MPLEKASPLKNLAIALASALTLAFTITTAAQAADTQNRFYPTILQSNMQDHLMYSPVGLGVVTSKAGFRIHPVTGHGAFHNGVDLAANLNDRVFCLLDGIVTRVGWRGHLGVAVEIYHPYPGLRTIVGHLNAYCVRPGEPVSRGRVIGYAGTTGRSTGVHVHYTVVMEDTKEYVEPYEFIKKCPQYALQLRSFKYEAQRMNNLAKFKQTYSKQLVDNESESDDLKNSSDKGLSDKNSNNQGSNNQSSNSQVSNSQGSNSKGSENSGSSASLEP